MKMLRWREIGTAPSEPGVYAWYCTPELSDFDVRLLIEEVNKCKAINDEEGTHAIISTFLHSHIFRHFAEQPYAAAIFGPLKPRYEGRLVHCPAVSTSLIEHLAENPDRIKTIKRILEGSVPNFSSPLYIGMSKNLARRLARHKSLIEKYHEKPSLVPQLETMPEADQRDHSFAKEVCSREIPPPLLSVMVEPISGVDDEWVDVENILNRIHFPLLGRN